MATTDQFKRRLRAAAEQMCLEIGEFPVANEECWLARVEEIAAQLGDAVATTLIEQQSAAHVEVAATEEANCPECGKQGRYRGDRERELISRRGPVAISEPEYYCPCCRKAFFPDDARDRC
ncbi:MAG: hypothetical protein E4H19_15915 [Chromatiales bacterium]|jgi:hypothetical protein|nr:MAG: hypothetical protein E4H19_15915 [Chromatiales bacterium]